MILSSTALASSIQKPEDSDWVVLPVANFDAYFGNTSLGRKYLKMVPQEMMERSDSVYGV